MKSCHMCDNALTNEELNSNNDLSFIDIGKSEKGYRVALRTGDNKATMILFERFDENLGWVLVSSYKPKYCPNCGRKLKENEK